MVKERVQALFAGYNNIRTISPEEDNAFAILLRGAALRFLLTRCHAWLNREAGALVNIKDPLEYVQKLKFHQQGNLSF